MLGAAALLVCVALFAAQTWRIIDAIGHVQESAVVPLPTPKSRGPSLSPTAAEVTPAPGRSGRVAEREPSAAEEVGPREDLDSVAATGPSDAPARATDSQSNVEVAGALLGAGVHRGDPGRAEVWDGKTELNILVLGVDRRPEGGDQNADVVILARLDLINQTLRSVSIPRDLLVDIPGGGQDRVNSAFNYGAMADPQNPAAGPGMVRDTIEQNFGIPIDGYVLVDFNGFTGVVDALGGIDVTVPKAIHDPAYPRPDYTTEVVDFAVGRQHMNGDRALKYARTRNADSDDERRDRQMQVLLALFERGKRLHSIARADQLILALGNAVQTSFGLEQQLLLARLAYQMDRGNIDMATLGQPLVAPGTTDAGAWVYIGDPVDVRSFVQQTLGVAGSAAGDDGTRATVP